MLGKKKNTLKVSETGICSKETKRMPFTGSNLLEISVACTVML